MKKITIILPNGRSFTIPAFTEKGGAVWVRNAHNEVVCVYDPDEPDMGTVIGEGMAPEDDFSAKSSDVKEGVFAAYAALVF